MDAVRDLAVINGGCKVDRGNSLGKGASPLPEVPAQAAATRRYLGTRGTSGKQARISRKEVELQGCTRTRVLRMSWEVVLSANIAEGSRAAVSVPSVCVLIHKSVDSCSMLANFGWTAPHPGQPPFFRLFPVNSACQNPTIHHVIQLQRFSLRFVCSRPGKAPITLEMSLQKPSLTIVKLSSRAGCGP